MKLIELIHASQHEAAGAALDLASREASQAPDPILLKILTGLSAWVASLFLIGFVVVGLNAKEVATLFLGGILSALAVALHRNVAEPGTFLRQSTLACMLSGHVLLLFGILVNLDRSGDESLLLLSLTQSLLCLLPAFAFRDTAYQTLTLLLTSALWTGYAVDVNIPWLFRLILATQVSAFGTLVLWHARRNSISYALALSIGAMIFFLDWLHSKSYVGSFDEPLWPTNLIITALLAAIAACFIPRESRRSSLILAVCALLFAVAFFSSPGLLFAIALLTLGYGLRDRIYSLLGYIGLPLFLVYFYYSLEVSLLEKSGILLTSGILCMLISLLACFSRRRGTAA
jgi:hypothetical protein